MVALLATSCSLGDPSDAGSINLYIEVDKSFLRNDETMTITVTARNVGNELQTLTGPSDCLLFVEILTEQGQVVWRSNAGCTGNTVTEEIVVGQDKVQSVVWDGRDRDGLFLSGGFYYIRPVARVTGGSYAGPLVSISVEGR